MDNIRPDDKKDLNTIEQKSSLEIFRSKIWEYKRQEEEKIRTETQEEKDKESMRHFEDCNPDELGVEEMDIFNTIESGEVNWPMIISRKEALLKDKTDQSSATKSKRAFINWASNSLAPELELKKTLKFFGNISKLQEIFKERGSGHLGDIGFGDIGGEEMTLFEDLIAHRLTTESMVLYGANAKEKENQYMFDFLNFLNNMFQFQMFAPEEFDKLFKEVLGS